MSINEEEGGDGLTMASAPPKRQEIRDFLGRTLSRGDHRRNSLGQPPSSSARRPSITWADKDYGSEPRLNGGAHGEGPPSYDTSTRVSRSQSSVHVPNHQSEWADGLEAQPLLQEAWKGLLQDVESHEKLASAKRWEELLSIKANVSELEDLAKSAQQRVLKRGKFRKRFDEFCLVAFEYSKLFNVIMNCAPEYVVAAWGVMKILLHANISAAKLQRNIEDSLIDIGNQLGIVNQILRYVPTEKMLNAVGQLYIKFNTFLREALSCFGKCLAKQIAQSLTMPWERKFQDLVDSIGRQFATIQSLANAGHMHVSLKSQSLLYSLLEFQHEQKAASDADRLADDLGVKTRPEESMRLMLEGMFQTFESRWLQRWEDMIKAPKHSSSENATHGQLCGACSSSIPHYTMPTETARSILAYVDELQRDILYFSVNVDSIQQFLQIRNGRLRLAGYRNRVAMSQHAGLRKWTADPASGLLWLEGHLESRFTDWMTGFMIDMVEQASRSPNSAVIRYFCQTRIADRGPSSAIRLLQSLLLHALSIINEACSFLDLQALRQRLKEAKDDVEDLWHILVDVLRALDRPCIWIMIDDIGALESDRDSANSTFALIKLLSDLSKHDRKVFKILISARMARRKLSTQAQELGCLTSAHSVISLQRGHNVQKLRAASSQRRRSIHEHPSKPSNDLALPSISIDNLLASDTDESLSDDPQTKKRNPPSHSELTRQNRTENTYLSTSCSSSESDILLDNLLASSSSSEDESTTAVTNHRHNEHHHDPSARNRRTSTSSEASSNDLIMQIDDRASPWKNKSASQVSLGAAPILPHVNDVTEASSPPAANAPPAPAMAASIDDSRSQNASHQKRSHGSSTKELGRVGYDTDDDDGEDSAFELL